MSEEHRKRLETLRGYLARGGMACLSEVEQRQLKELEAERGSDAPPLSLLA